ncbi:MAG TPA: hypothetical protein VKV95_23970 [Terriglobia bacterium]|nr:hypothetical protein [Terriglobia bacterium]
MTRADAYMITFTGQNGRTMRYRVDDVEAIQFGDAPYRSDAGPAIYQRPGDDHRDYPGNRNDQADENQGDRNYDQARMERVIIPAGTEVAVRTNVRIDARDAVEGQSYPAQIEENVRGSDGSIAIPRGSDASLIIRQMENNGDLILDVDSITVGGRRYRVSTADEEIRAGAGARRTGEYAGGGAMLGAIVGAIAGGGKGAAIGAAAGAGSGAITAQIVTRGKEVHVPAESVVRFRLDRPLRLHLWS